MAIDSAAKRFSMMADIIRAPLVPPDGTIDLADRQTFQKLYGGIAFQTLTGSAGVITCQWVWDIYDID